MGARMVVRPFRAHARTRGESVLRARISAGIAPAREGGDRRNQTGAVISEPGTCARARGEWACEVGNNATSTRACARAREERCNFGIFRVHKKEDELNVPCACVQEAGQFFQSIKRDGCPLCRTHRARARGSFATHRAHVRTHARKSEGSRQSAFSSDIACAREAARRCHG